MGSKYSETWLNRYANDIDAAMFSGDTFHDPENRRALRDWIERWQKKLDQIDKEILSDDI